jgi:2-keto-4-pentenoate hydratase/2-oxohepta-3-ene-1,7-dioic acid hydratase in catechol pathway
LLKSAPADAGQGENAIEIVGSVFQQARDVGPFSAGAVTVRLARCICHGQAYAGVVQDDHVVIPALAPSRPTGLDSVLTIIDGGEAALRRLREFLARAPASSRLPLAEVHITAPIPRPRKNIMCLGWNYADHVAESAAASGRQGDKPSAPVIFTKAVTSVIGPYDTIPYDGSLTEQLDWEVELGVVIGREGRHIAVDSALDYVFGYCVINDLSARDVQFRHKQYFLGKSLDGSCPMGPWIVTADALPDPQSLELTCTVNGVVKQRGNSADQLFKVAEVISVLSRYLTLEPGDIIATGTPSGVGFARQPPEFLRPGDVVECEISGIGALINRVSGPH